MIKKYSLKALQTAVNHALALDETMPSKIAALHDKVIEIIISPLEVRFFITFEQNQFILLDVYEGEPDTIIRSSPMGLIRLSLLPASSVRSLFNDKIKITGDIELGQNIKKLFDQMDIDWEGHLAHFTGDVLAFQVGNLFRRGLAVKQHFSDSMRHNFRDYFQDELRLFPSGEEINDFFHDIDQLSLDVERLQARINLLMSPHEIH